MIKADRALAAGEEQKDNVRCAACTSGFPVRRGEVGKRIKELKDGMQLDRTGCSRFQANQFGLLLAAAGFTLPSFALLE